MQPSISAPVRHPAAWRGTIGRVLRRTRREQGLRLADVCARAGLSPQYLSEVERGRKEASSQVLAAVTDALGITLVDLAVAIADELAGRVRGRAGRAGRPSLGAEVLELSSDAHRTAGPVAGAGPGGAGSRGPGADRALLLVA